MIKFHRAIDRFFPEADRLRAVFDRRFADPRQGSSQRFVWDWWHVPDQYTLLRTPAYAYFEPALYRRFHRHLVAWGRQHLGCHEISPPWLSCYIDGCRQEIHADVPHGPWAWVYSLTPWDRRQFSGGETLLVKPEVLSYWRGLDPRRGLEMDDVFLRLPAKYNRLTVFDPRLPHGVREVEGSRDPRQGRLVIHGWFVEPRPFVTGALRPAAITTPLAAAIQGAEPGLVALGPLQGTLSVRIEVQPRGSVSRCVVLTNNVMAAEDSAEATRRAVVELRRHLLAARFPRAAGKSRITVPVLFS